MQTKNAISIIFSISAAVIIFLVWLIYYREIPKGPVAAWAYYLPALNSLFNTISATCVVAGIILIKQGNKHWHKQMMISATIASALFLTSYIIYHEMVGHVVFNPDRAGIKNIYRIILFSHIILSIVVVPMILTTLFFAFSGRFESHKKIAKWTWPIWLYVSVTGVLIFVILQFFNNV
jgi:putative membrane protein